MTNRSARPCRSPAYWRARCRDRPLAAQILGVLPCKKGKDYISGSQNFVSDGTAM
jgi:hypothetical protein